MTESQLASALEFEAKKLGAEELAFPLIVASGKNSSPKRPVANLQNN